jgi:hypothetical protein
VPKPATAESRLSAPTPGGIDTDMLADVEADKAAPEDVAQRILAATAAGHLSSHRPRRIGRG